MSKGAETSWITIEEIDEDHRDIQELSPIPLNKQQKTIERRHSFVFANRCLQMQDRIIATEGPNGNIIDNIAIQLRSIQYDMREMRHVLTEKCARMEEKIARMEEKSIQNEEKYSRVLDSLQSIHRMLATVLPNTDTDGYNN